MCDISQIENLINDAIKENLSIIETDLFFKKHFKEFKNMDIEGIEITIETLNNVYDVTKNIQIFNYGKSMPKAISKEFTSSFGGNINITLCFDENIKNSEMEKYYIVINMIYLIFLRAINNKYLKDLPLYDATTGLRNTFGMIQLEGTIKASEYACIFLNIKNFNFYNRLYGDQNGNILLKLIGLKLRENLEENLEFVCRPGGDHFCIFLKKEKLAEKLFKLQNFEVVLNYENKDELIKFNFWTGVYNAEKNTTISESLLRSHVALNNSKELKEDIVFFKKEMLNQIDDKKTMLQSIKEALLNKEFVVYYQPKVNAQENVLNGGEALIRWYKDDKIISPNKFIPVLEKEKNNFDVDFYVLERVCKDINKWKKDGLEPTKISVNFSKQHLSDENFSKKIITMLEEYNIEPKYIEIELTESSTYESFSKLTTFLKTIRSYGISVSIDDFGTGYSSLTLLKDIEVDSIKLDKTFVDTLEEENDKDLFIVKTIIDLTKHLNMSVIAEGVETLQQLETLKFLGCFNIQGYYYDKPMDSNAFAQRLLNKKY